MDTNLAATVTIADIINKVKELATQYPDAVYMRLKDGGCDYNKGGVINGPTEEGCIFGHALRALGVDTTNYHGTPIVSILPVFGKYFVTEQVLWCGRFQDGQDQGKTWGSVLAEMQVMYPNI